MVKEARARPFRILLVEDNPGDADLVQEILMESDDKKEITVAVDGFEALRCLREAPRPDLILLDLNLPKKSGREVLEEIKTTEALQRIPVVVLTSSEADDDLSDVYRLHANCYLAKPVDLEEFIKVVRAIEQFWLGFVKLPSFA
ncbi:MAG: response regulator [Myxococcales bacterium]|nr:response regulator [Myxococcales bacterium]